MTTDVTTERQLIDRMRSGDERAVGELAARYGSKIYQHAFRYMKNREDTEEVVQDVLLKVSRNIGAFRADAAFSSWLYRITFNAAMSRLRRAGHQAQAREHGSGDDVFEQLSKNLPDPSIGPEGLALQRQVRRQLMEAVRELPSIYRSVVVLRDLEGLSTGEASTRLQINEQTLKSRLHRGRVLLRHRLADLARLFNLHFPHTLSLSYLS